jgi:hypothetical protein
MSTNVRSILQDTKHAVNSREEMGGSMKDDSESIPSLVAMLNMEMLKLHRLQLNDMMGNDSAQSFASETNDVINDQTAKFIGMTCKLLKQVRSPSYIG